MPPKADGGASKDKLGYTQLNQEDAEDKQEEDRSLELLGFAILCGALIITPVICLYNAVQIGEGPPGILAPEVHARTTTTTTPPHPLDTVEGWTFTDWSKCNASCGFGWSTRTATCKMEEGRVCEKGRCTNSTKNDTKYKCGPNPTTAQACADKTECKWQTSDWGDCLTDCGAGWQKRSVTCTNRRGDNAEASFCVASHHVDDKPIDRKFCKSSQYCDWTLGDWTVCSETCGMGKQTRNVSCDKKDCSGKPPPEERPCKDASACKWSDWGECNALCGVGTKTRHAQCDESQKECNALTQSQPCRGTSCSWIIGDWSNCSAEGSSKCEEGKQNRSVSCLLKGDSSSDTPVCKEEQRPNATRTCKAGVGCKTSVEEEKDTAADEKKEHHTTPPPTCACRWAWPLGLFAGVLNASCSWGWALGVLLALSIFRPQQTMHGAWLSAVMAPQAAPIGLCIAGVVSVFVEAHPSEATLNMACTLGTYIVLILVPLWLVSVGLKKGGPHRVMDATAVSVLSLVLGLFLYFRLGGEKGTKMSL